MKVCFLVSTYEPDTIGGQGEVVRNLQERFLKCSVDAYVLTSGLETPGYPHTIRTHCSRRLFYPVSMTYLNWIRKMDFDVINVHGESGMSIVPLLVASKCRTKIVTSLHTSYLSESESLRGLGMHGVGATKPTLDEHIVRYLLTPTKFFGAFVDCALSDKIVAVCKKTADECKVEYGIPEGKMSVIYNGVDVGRFSPQKKRNVVRDKYSLGDKPVILSVGCGTIRKGIPFLLRSMRDVRDKIPSARLIVVGPSKYKDQMISTTNELGIEENVIFSGAVPREELPYYYSACDIVAMPSLQEGFPVVVLEAMASGRPVVASRVGGIPEAIETGSNGILFEPGNVCELTQALVTLLDNECLRRKMGREARRVAEAKYDWKEIAFRYLAEFKSLF
jgi:glycosyltransferase involved in cell wall biosynthesis